METAKARVSATSTSERASRRRWRLSGRGDGAGQPAGQWAGRTSAGAAPRARSGVGEPPGQQPGAGPQQRRASERPVVDRDGRHTFGGQHELVAVPAGQPEHHPGGGQQPQVQAEAGPAGPAGCDPPAAGRGDRAVRASRHAGRATECGGDRPGPRRPRLPPSRARPGGSAPKLADAEAEPSEARAAASPADRAPITPTRVASTRARRTS